MVQLTTGFNDRLKTTMAMLNDSSSQKPTMFPNLTMAKTTADDSETSAQSLLIIQISCLSAIAIVGIVANLMIVTTTCMRRKRKTSDYFILNLAIADLMVCAVGIPLDIYEQLHPDAWQYGAVLCKVIYPTQTLLVLISIMTLTAMSLERYRAIMTPLKQKLNKKSILVAIVLIWLLGISVVAPYAKALNYNGVYCDEEWPKKYAKYYTLVLFIIDYCIPLTIIGFCYARAGFELHKKFKTASFNRRESTSKIHDMTVKRRLKSNKRVTKVFSLAVLMFVVCMLPADCYWMWKSFGEGSSFKYENHLKTFTVILVYANSAINPFIFGACHGVCSQRSRRMRVNSRTAFSTTSERHVDYDQRSSMIPTARKWSECQPLSPPAFPGKWDWERGWSECVRESDV